jgi:hypothetical protein
MNQIEKFEKLCTQIFFWKGEFHFPFDGIQHDGRFSNIVKDTEYPLFESKMGNLLKVLNKDMSKLNMDTKELWEVI